MKKSVSRNALRSFLLATALSPAWAACAEGDARAETGVDQPVSVEIVRGGGVAEVYRRDGADYAAYGPDGKTSVMAPEQQALQALAGASDVQFARLDVASEGDAAGACPAADCVGGFPVQARVPAPTGAVRRLALDVIGSWLHVPGGQGPACLVEYRYAVTFSHAGRTWEVLLDYGCGRYRVNRDGVELASADVAEPKGEADLDALFKAARK